MKIKEEASLWALAGAKRLRRRSEAGLAAGEPVLWATEEAAGGDDATAWRHVRRRGGPGDRAGGGERGIGGHASGGGGAMRVRWWLRLAGEVEARPTARDDGGSTGLPKELRLAAVQRE
uniref:DUF834 domain-containing protein n=1 Tax=Oryza nivara TaxID=4536 RepID=A0A0E0I1K0_ORYNI